MKDLDIRDQNDLVTAFSQADNILMKKYIKSLGEYDVVPVSKELADLNVSETTRLFKIDKIVYDQNENNLNKLTSVYNALSTSGGSLVIIIDSDGSQVDYYMGTKARAQNVSGCQSVLQKSLSGNFPGSQLSPMRNNAIEAVIKDIFQTSYESIERSISVVSGISSSRDLKQAQDNKTFIQGIEKMIDSMYGEKYTVVLMADPVMQQQIDEMRSGYEKLYSELVPFSATDLSFTANESVALTESLTTGFTSSVSESLSRTQSYTENYTSSSASSKSKNVNPGAVTGLIGAAAGAVIAGPLGAVMGAQIGSQLGGAVTFGSSKTETESTSRGKTQSEGSTKGTTESTSEQKGTSNTSTEGHGRSLQIKFENKTVTNLLERIDLQLERLNQSSDLGMWNCAAYVLADDVQTSRVAASNFQSIMRGENSSAEASAITTWVDKDKKAAVRAYIEKLSHPLLDLDLQGGRLPYVTPTSMISSKELTLQGGLPHKSVPGLPVVEHIAFGREVLSYNDSDSGQLDLGHIFHMGQVEKKNVSLDVDSLASHTFITGSTGAGKSNTIYKMLSEAERKGIKFLVIEPAKGEYKNVFGSRSDVRVFGSNPVMTDLLKINPFKFPRGTHVLEHVDRLIEIFNVCWPMYAAMPAVLKDAVIRSYENCGWDLLYSKNALGYDIFPTFKDLLVDLEHVIQESAYSDELKSNYIGALVTRVKSMTNGLNGQMFSSDEVDNNVLFDSNCIVDLSRIGSSETKSLIMGVMVMRLNEHRAAFSEGMNQPLRHLTVLEEAHNILKATSVGTPGEGSNMAEKSVEMISNAIAEMRTFGEGFIIADQSPNAVDISAIRNTNTKIIMRLPDDTDRVLVGKSAGLRDEQFDEIAKLKKGVAVIYQNDWLEPILSQIDKFETGTARFEYKENLDQLNVSTKLFKTKALELMLHPRLHDRIEIDVDGLEKMLPFADVSTRERIMVHQMLNEYSRKSRLDLWEPEKFDKLAKYVSEFVGGKTMIRHYIKQADGLDMFNQQVEGLIEERTHALDADLKRAIIQCHLKEMSGEGKAFFKLYSTWVTEMNKVVV